MYVFVYALGVNVYLREVLLPRPMNYVYTHAHARRNLTLSRATTAPHGSARLGRACRMQVTHAYYTFMNHEKNAGAAVFERLNREKLMLTNSKPCAGPRN